MNFEALPVDGVYLVRPSMAADDRGSFGRLFCAEEFARRGLTAGVAQCSLSRNSLKGTLRGMHYQDPPHAETKLVRCQSGRSFHALIDLRHSSASHMSWCATELSAEQSAILYIPEGVAHGFLTLEDKTDIFYQMSTPYCPDSARGIRWNDPAFDVSWPGDIVVISERDRQHPDFPVGG